MRINKGNDECPTFRLSLIGTIESFRVSYDKTKKNGGFKWPLNEIDKDGLGGGIKQFINVNSCLMAISRFQTSPFSYEVTKRQFSMAKETMRKAGVIGDRKPINETKTDWEDEELLEEAEAVLKKYEDEQAQTDEAEETSNKSEEAQAEQAQTEEAPSTTPETMTSTGNKFAGEDPETYYTGFLDQIFHPAVPSKNFSKYGFKALKVLLLSATGRAANDKLNVALNSHDGELSRRLGKNFGKIEREYYEAEDDGDQLVISINEVVSKLTADGELSEEKVIAKAKEVVLGSEKGKSDSNDVAK